MDKNRVAGSIKEIKGAGKQRSAKRSATQNCRATANRTKLRAKSRTPLAASPTRCATP